MKKKMFLIFSFICLILSIGIMALPNAYLVTWCYPDLDGNWESTFAYFDTYLLGFQGFDIIENIMQMIVLTVALVCDTLFLHHLVFSEQLKKASLIILAIGVWASCFISSFEPSTNYGYPNFVPFTLLITTIICAIFMILRLIRNKFKGIVFVLTAIVMLCSVFSMFMSSWITIPGALVSVLLTTTFVFQVIQYNVDKKKIIASTEQ